MRFGILYFPTAGPGEKNPAEYYDEGLRLVRLAEELGYFQLKVVEHHFFDYGGYSPSPTTFLAAAAAVTDRIRIGTGAVIPAFAHPIKLAGQLAMLDNISHGRLDVGFGRGFLPDEFAAFGIPMDESRERFEEGAEACVRLWTEEDVVFEGAFHRFGPVTLLPRPAQLPHPPVFSAVTTSVDSCAAAGRAGRGLQIIAAVSPTERVQELIAAYRKGRVDAGLEPDTGRIELSYPCYVAEDGESARAAGRRLEGVYGEKISAATLSWAGTRSSAYPGYEKLADAATRGSSDFDDRVEAGRVLAGDPAEVAAQIERIAGWYGEDVDLTLTTHSGHVSYEESARALTLFAEEVAPRLSFARLIAEER
ncbi:LLM class flavin-dependent oxidoreductase [Streptomyces sp. S1]|uniref:LLM class flavin-dependent oxidoreductase n=1 Tax=Streptomyces sp. S1 TaxID=718288 RepID=UPI003D75FAA4